MAYSKAYAFTHHGMGMYDSQTFGVGFANYCWVCVIVPLFKLFVFIYSRVHVDSGRDQHAHLYP